MYQPTSRRSADVHVTFAPSMAPCVWWYDELGAPLMEKRQWIRCTITSAPGDRSRSITIPCADGSTYSAVVWAKSRLSFPVPESLGGPEIPGWISVTYIGQVIPGAIQVEVQESSGHRTPLNIQRADVRGINDLKRHLFDWATQYYVAARFAAVEGLSPVCANLFHHAIEMYLKGYLCVRSVKNLQTEFGHDLVKIFREFKTIQEVADSMLNRFDTILKRQISTHYFILYA
jgi:hypothetical protein